MNSKEGKDRLGLHFSLWTSQEILHTLTLWVKEGKEGEVMF